MPNMRHKVQVSLNNEAKALLMVESEATGDSLSSCLRRAARAYYDKHRSTSAYREALDHLNSIYPEEVSE